MSGPARKLARIQRAAATAILGAMRNTATDFLDAHADLLPMKLLMEKACYRAAIRLATLPPSHPLHKYVRKTARCYRRQHRSPLHELMHYYGLQPREMECIQPVVHQPTWQPRIAPEIAGSQDEALEAQAERARELQVYSDGSEMDGGVGAAAVLYDGATKVGELSFHLGRASRYGIQEGEAVGLLLGAELLRDHHYVDKAAFAVDSQSTLREMAMRKPTTGQHIMSAIHERIESVDARHGEPELAALWVPAHIGVVGNEAVDALAKAAARGQSSEQSRLPTLLRTKLPWSKSALRKTYKTELKSKAKRIWTKSPRYTRVRTFDDKLPSPKYLAILDRLTRAQASILTQLRSGHVPLQKYLYRIKRAPAATCPCCGERDETVFHYLLTCSAHEPHRRTALGRSRTSMKQLLSNEKGVMALMRYVGLTRRFEGIYGDVTPTYTQLRDN